MFIFILFFFIFKFLRWVCLYDWLQSGLAVLWKGREERSTLRGKLITYLNVSIDAVDIFYSK